MKKKCTGEKKLTLQLWKFVLCIKLFIIAANFQSVSSIPQCLISELRKSKLTFSEFPEQYQAEKKVLLKPVGISKVDQTLFFCSLTCVCVLLSLSIRRAFMGDNHRHNFGVPSFICSAQRQIVKFKGMQTRMSKCSLPKTHQTAKSSVIPILY